MSTNILINSRSMNGIITISDGTATLENGDLNCDDIISSTITSGIFTCRGEFRSNIIGPYTIPTLVSSEYGSLISYGNSSGNGATDFTNYQSTYNITKGGFNFWNKSSTVPLTNLAIIDNSQTYFKSQLIGCTAENPVNNTSIVNKTYCDSTFMSKINNVTESINGLKTFTNNTNFTGSLRTKTNCRINEIDDYTGNTISPTFPMATTVLLRISSGTSMTLNLPQLTANERGMVFTFLKSSNVVNCTVNAFTGQGIVIATDITSPVASSTNILSADKVMMKLYVGYYQTLTFWVEITEFSTYDRSRLQFYEYFNTAQSNAVTLTFPMPPTIAVRNSSGSSMTITLPALSTSVRGQVFTFVKLVSNLTVTFITTGTNNIYPLNNLSGSPTTNSTILSSNKSTCKLAVGWFNTTTYWIEVSDYSTFDIDQINTKYVNRNDNITESINGFKTFTNNVEINNATRPSLILKTSATEYTNIRQNGGALQFQNLSTLGAQASFLFTGASVFNISQNNINTNTNVEVQTRLIKSVDTAGAHTVFDNMTGGTLTIGGTASTNSIRGDTTLPQSVVIGGTASIGGIITLNASSYSFPLPSTNNLGYYYQETGASYNVSNVFNPETIFNTSITIPVGIWRVDFTIQTTCVAAGTISAAQSYVSTVSNQPISSAVPYLGAIIRTTIPKVFALNEVDLMISSFTYYQTTAGQVRVTVARTYTGTYGIVAAMAFTRIA